MQVSDPNLAPLVSSKLHRTATLSQEPSARAAVAGDDIHLSELVIMLRSLVPDSPERQARIEWIARSYADGTYSIDAEATATKIVDDSLRRH